MRHSKILMAAIAAGLGGSSLLAAPSSIERQLYDYARDRKFPPPETLARKGAELAGGDFPFLSLAEAPEATRIYFTAFRAVIEALEPFHEDDPAGEAETDAAASDRAASADVDAFVEIEIVFRPLGEENLVYVQAQTKDGERKQVGFWSAEGGNETLLLTVHESDVRDIPPIAGDGSNSTEASDETAAPVDQTGQAAAADPATAADPAGAGPADVGVSAVENGGDTQQPEDGTAADVAAAPADQAAPAEDPAGLDGAAAADQAGETAAADAPAETGKSKKKTA